MTDYYLGQIECNFSSTVAKCMVYVDVLRKTYLYDYAVTWFLFTGLV
jgi:hypothetical protein